MKILKSKGVYIRQMYMTLAILNSDHFKNKTSTDSDAEIETIDEIKFYDYLGSNIDTKI